MASHKRLKTGFTTGTAAAAAAKGALYLILNNKKPDHVPILLPTGETIDIAVNTCKSRHDNQAECTVIKDAGDDPDVTHKAVIGAVITLIDKENPEKIILSGGKGVGVVTKPGLEIQPGEPAINQGPRNMIAQAVSDLLGENSKRSVKVEIFVPEGEKLAAKTLNARLGILGGISILGTTGIVKPMSHDAYMATITSSLSVAEASGLSRVILTTGRRSEKFSQALFHQAAEEAFVQIGDFFKKSLEAASEKGFKKITLAVFFGKALKMAQGSPHTHAAKSRLSLKQLSAWAFEATADRQFARNIRTAHTARRAFDLTAGTYPRVIFQVGGRMLESAAAFAGPGPVVQGIIFDYNGKVVFNAERP